jgi:hypothetical protein
MIGLRSTALTVGAAALLFGALFAVARATDDSEAPTPRARPTVSPPVAVRVAPLGQAAPLPALRRRPGASATDRVRTGPEATAPEPEPAPDSGEAGIETTTTPAPAAPVPVPTPTPTESPGSTAPANPPGEEPGVIFDDSG